MHSLKKTTYIFRGGGHVFGVLDGQVEMMVVFVTGGPHVTIVVHVQPQPHQLLDQAPLSQRVRPVLRPGLRLKKNTKNIYMLLNTKCTGVVVRRYIV